MCRSTVFTLARRFLSTRSKGTLDGVVVIDMTRVLAGPYCTMLLGDLGANVVKIEQPGSGDMTRQWGPPFAPGGESAYFLCVNRNKRSVTLDFKNPEGKEILKRLVAKADVFVENFIPGDLKRIGLGYEELSHINPGLVYASVSGYGPVGPYSQKPGYDVIAEGEGGFLHITGTEETPCKPGVAITDISTGLYCHGAILAALYARTRTGIGQKIDVSLFETQLALLCNIGSNYLIAGQEGRRLGTAHESVVPYQAFKTKDGYFVFGAANDRQFRIASQLLQRPEWADDPRFKTNADRVEHRAILLQSISDIMLTKTTATWTNVFRDARLPGAPINSITEAFSHPQVRSTKMIETVLHPTAGEIKLVGLPVKFSENAQEIRLAPPCLGQHTREVLKEMIGVTDSEADSLSQRKII